MLPSSSVRATVWVSRYWHGKCLWQREGGWQSYHWQWAGQETDLCPDKVVEKFCRTRPQRQTQVWRWAQEVDEEAGSQSSGFVVDTLARTRPTSQLSSCQVADYYRIDFHVSLSLSFIDLQEGFVFSAIFSIWIDRHTSFNQELFLNKWNNILLTFIIFKGLGWVVLKQNFQLTRRRYLIDYFVNLRIVQILRLIIYRWSQPTGHQTWDWRRTEKCVNMLGQLLAHWGSATSVWDNWDNCWTSVANTIFPDQVWFRMSVIPCLLLLKSGRL